MGEIKAASPALVQLHSLKVLVAEIEKLRIQIGQDCHQIGQKLDKIRERELWRAEAKTWNEFCLKHGWSRRWANELIQAERAFLSLPESSNLLGNQQTVSGSRPPEPPSIRAGLELSKVPEEKRAEVVKQAKKSGAEVTAPAIKAAAAEVSKPPIELDETGCAIPKAIQPLWDRRQELQELMTAVSKVKCKVQELYKAHDPLVAWVESQSVIPQLEGAYFSLSEGRLHALCLVCQGHPETKEGGCAECKNTGFLNKKFYEMGTNTKLRDFRERSIKLKEQRANKTA